MRTAADTLNEAHPIVASLVDLAQRRAGSRMTAYHDVARSIGQSASWVRKLVGRQPVAIERHVFENIANAYRSACQRIEAERDLERARFLALGKVLHEIDQGGATEMGMAKRGGSPNARPADPVVADTADGASR
jgi:hypothetical protein